MTPTRTVVMTWVLAVLLMGGTAEDVKMSATVGEDVLLPCNCSPKTDKVAWQDHMTMVNFYNFPDKVPIGDLYKNRSRLFLSHEKGNCTLLLLQVSFSDQRRFTCHAFVGSVRDETVVELNITKGLPYTPTPPVDLTALNAPSEHIGGDQEERTVFQTVIPILALLLVAGAVTVFLVLRKRHQNIQEEKVVEDVQAGVPMMRNCPV